ncbi:lipopolysaccharide heptosyltransferase I [soil metagenome]
MGDRGWMGSEDGPPLRVLIVRVGAMGDVLHAMPAVAALRELRPDWSIRWAIEPRWSPLLAAETCNQASSEPSRRDLRMPLVDGWLSVETRAWKKDPFSRATAASVLKLRSGLRTSHFDVAVDMQGLIRSAVVGRMASAAHFVGRQEPREPIARLFYDQCVPIASPHVVEQGCELLGAAVQTELRPGRVTIPIDAAAEAWCDEVVSDEQPFVVMAPTAGWGAKEWPRERYGAVAAALGKAGYQVLINAASPGDGTAAAVVKASNGAARAIPCTIPEMIALWRRASLAIAGDTGPLHLAAALERPLVGIYGPTDPVRTGPYGAGTVFPGRVLRHPSSVTDHARKSAPEAGLLRISADEVAETALEILGK